LGVGLVCIMMTGFSGLSNSHTPKNQVMRIRSVLRSIAMLLVILCATGLVAYAQSSPPPPMLPGMPDQAPLGGLSLLAAAGGAYAWNKLRQRNQN